MTVPSSHNVCRNLAREDLSESGLSKPNLTTWANISGFCLLHKVAFLYFSSYNCKINTFDYYQLLYNIITVECAYNVNDYFELLYNIITKECAYKVNYYYELLYNIITVECAYNINDYYELLYNYCRMYMQRQFTVEKKRKKHSIIKQ